MDSAQRDSILQLCNQFEQLPVSDAFSEAYKEKGDYSQIIMDGKPLVFWISTIKNLVSQFKAELETDNWFFLPFQCSLLRGDADPTQSLNQIIDKVTNKQPIDDILNQVYWLVEYQIRWGFWNKSAVKVHDVKAIDLKNKVEEISLLKSEINEAKKGVELLKSDVLEEKKSIGLIKTDLETEKQKVTEFVTVEKQGIVTALNEEKLKVTDFFAARTSELKEITDNHTQAKALIAEISNYSKEANTAKSDVNAILETQKQNLDEIKKKMTEHETTFDGQKKGYAEFEETLKQKIEAYTKQNESFDSILKWTEGKKEFFEKKEAEIIKLTGFAADGSLGHTFTRRKDELNKPLRFWKWAMPLMTVLTAIWVVTVFTQFFTSLPTSIEWGVVVMNIVKTIPMFILLGFTVNQYTKERNLQEEYAFKAAVAMTISAYSDKVGDVPRKETLIVDTVQRIYTPPKIQSERTGSIFSFRTKKLTDTVKTLADAVKELKP